MEEIEEQYVRSIMSYPDMLVDTLSDVPIQAIKNPKLRAIYIGVIDLWENGHTIDEISIHARIKNDVSLTDLAKISTDGIPSKVHLPHYAGEIKRTFQKRRIWERLSVATKNLSSSSVTDVLADISELVADEMHVEKVDPHITAVVERFKRTQKHNKKHGMGLSTGFECFDKKYITYQYPHIWTVGGFTSTGKTSFLIEMLVRLYKANKSTNPRCLVLSTEMNSDQNIARLSARHTTFSSHYILSGNARNEHQDGIDTSLEDIANYNLYIHDDVYELKEMKSLIRKQKYQGGCDIVFVDYLQNISVSGASSEYEATDQISKGFQKLAKETQTCIVLFSQISNAAARDDQGLLQYKGGGSISAVTDIGIMLKKHKEQKGLIMLGLEKHRHGPLMKQALLFEEHFTKLTEVENEINF